jgi:hypothetical protein
MKKLIGLCLVVLMTGFAQAAVVNYAVDNYSFELPGTVKCKNWDGETSYPDVPGWTDGDVTAADSGVEKPTVGGPSDGLWSAFMKSTDSAVYQVTSNLIAADEGYTLMVDGRATSGTTGANLQLMMELFYDVDGVQTTLASQTVIVPDRVSPYPWQTFSLTIDSASVPVGAIGHYIGIKFDNPSTASNWIGIDNVRLTSAVPEPATMLLFGLGSLLLARTKH